MVALSSPKQTLEYSPCLTQINTFLVLICHKSITSKCSHFLHFTANITVPITSKAKSPKMWFYRDRNAHGYSSQIQRGNMRDKGATCVGQSRNQGADDIVVSIFQVKTIPRIPSFPPNVPLPCQSSPFFRNNHHHDRFFSKHAWAERGPSRCRWLLPVLTRWSGLVVLTAFGRCVPRWMSNVRCPMVIPQIEKWSTS